MTVRKIMLMSPREPSGTTWLINCLLELGVKTYFYNQSYTWQHENNSYRLTPAANVFKKWLPVLNEQDSFMFREGIEVEWSHNWPTHEHDEFQVIFFTRDPRDSLYSRYKREAPRLSFEEFLDFPDAQTLLNRIHNWRLFNLAWRQHPRFTLFRFEDYKADAKALLMRILQSIELQCSEKDIERAVNSSSFERAAEAEHKYRQNHPEDTEIINRSGKAGEWKEGQIQQATLKRIESICADAMLAQGYPAGNSICNADYTSIVNMLPFLQNVKLPAMAASRDREVINHATAFANSRHLEQILEKARHPWWEYHLLIGSLQTLADIQGLRTSEEYWQSLRSRFAQPEPPAPSSTNKELAVES